MEAIEPAILAALISRDPLLLIGPHGTGKSYLLLRLAQALGLEFRHYNASLLNYDDLVGYPLPSAHGGLEYIRTPATIWEAQVVFIDEISRCRPDMQNKLFSIVQERRVQGLPLHALRYCWSAMNPPLSGEGDTEQRVAYLGCEPLDLALADRFAFVVEVPGWESMTDEQRQEMVLHADEPLDPTAAQRLRHFLAEGQARYDQLRITVTPRLGLYVCAVVNLLAKAGVHLSARRAAQLLRNILAVHAALSIQRPGSRLIDAAALALTHSIPDRATGQSPDSFKLNVAHAEAVRAVSLDQAESIDQLSLESDPFRRALQAMRLKSMASGEFSGVIADALSTLPQGKRHALAAALFETGDAARLLAAVAGQCAELYRLAALPAEVDEIVSDDDRCCACWDHICVQQMNLNDDDPEDAMTLNLLTGLFAKCQVSSTEAVDRVMAAWHEGRQLTKEMIQ